MFIASEASLESCLENSLDSFRRQLQVGMDADDLDEASLALWLLSQHRYFLGTDLPTLAQELKHNSAVLRDLDQDQFFQCNEIIRHAVLNLLGRSNPQTFLVEDVSNEDHCQCAETLQNAPVSLAIFHLNQQILHVLFGKSKLSQGCRTDIRLTLENLQDEWITSVFYFYEALSLLAPMPSQFEKIESSKQSNEDPCLQTVDRSLEFLLDAPESGAMSLSHKAHLIRAEKSRVLGQKWIALDAYDQAIAEAKAQGCVHEEALANELAARFYADWGKDKVASGYMQEAYECYLRWGSVAKVEDLQTRYPEYLSFDAPARLPMDASDELDKAHQSQIISLREYEPLFSSLVSAAPVGLFRTNINGEYLYVNERWCQISGLGSDQALGKGWAAGIYSEDYDFTMTEWTHAIQAGRPFSLEYRCQHVDEQICWIDAQLAPEYDEQDNPVGYVGVITDITASKQLEQEQKKLTSILKSSPDYMAIADPKGDIIWCNDNIADLFQESQPHELTPSHMSQFHPEWATEMILEQGFSTALEQGRWHGETSILDASGREIPVSHWIVAHRDESGSLESFSFVMRDITDRQQLLAEQQRQLAIIESTSNFIASTDLNGNILSLNHSWRELLQCEGATQSLDRAVLSELYPAWVTDMIQDEALPAAIESGMWMGETALLDGQGGEMPVSQVVIAHKSPQDEVESFSIIARNISDLKQTDKSLKLKQFALEKTAVGSFWIRKDGQIVDVNESACSSLGYHRHELKALSVWDIDTNMQPQDWFSSFWNTLTQESSIRLESTHRRKDGSVFAVEVVSCYLEYEGEGVAFAQIQDISDRKRYEQEILESKAFLQTVLDTFPLAIFWKDCESRFIGVNQNFARDAGFSNTQDLIGLTDFDMPWANSEAEAYRADDLAVMNSDTPKLGIVETQVQADGTQIWLETNKLPLHDLADRVIGVMCTYQDITARKRYEQEILESKSFLQTVLDTFPLSIFWKDRESRYIGGNQNFARDAGFSRTEDIVGLTDFDMPWANTEAKDYRADDQAVMNLDTPKLGIIETQVQATGEQIWLETNKLPLHDLENRVIGVLGTYQNVSVRELAEEQLRASEERFRQAIEDAPFPIMIHAEEGAVLQINSTWTELTGYRHADIPTIHQWVENAYGESAATILKNTISKKYALTEGWDEGEFKINTKYGNQCIWQFRSAPLRALPDGRRVVISMAVDVTKRRQAEDDRKVLLENLYSVNQELEQANQKLSYYSQTLEQKVEQRTFELKEAMRLADQANQAKSDFLASMSHELRTPLNGLLGYAQILNHSSSMSEKDREGVSIIQSCGMHLLTLINDVLDIAKVEAGRFELAPRPVALSSLLQNILEIFQVKATQKGLIFSCRPSSRLPEWVEVDEKRLSQVLLNLLGNAIKFTTQGRVTLTVDVVERKAKNAVLAFEVTDTGVGISDSDLGKLFQAFEQVGDQFKHSEGTGLGLVISQRIIHLMGGEIAVKSELGIGSEFSFTIQVPVVSNFEEHASLPRPQKHIIGYEGENRRILVIDDRWENRAVLKNLLSPLGFQIVEAVNGKVGLELIEQNPPDLIVLDLLMPEMNGYDFLTVLRGNDDTRSMKVIMSSASVSIQDQMQSIDAGANAFLPKPLEAQALFDAIATQLSLTWIYASPVTPNAPSTHKDEWVVPSRAVLKELMSFVKLGSIVELRHYLEALKREDQKYCRFSQTLLKQANSFDFEEMEELLKTYLECGASSQKSNGMRL